MTCRAIWTYGHKLQIILFLALPVTSRAFVFWHFSIHQLDKFIGKTGVNASVLRISSFSEYVKQLKNTSVHNIKLIEFNAIHKFKLFKLEVGEFHDVIESEYQF